MSFFDELFEDQAKQQAAPAPQQQQQQKPPQNQQPSQKEVSRNQLIDSLFGEDDDDDSKAPPQQIQQHQQQGSKFAAAFAAMKDLKRQDKEQIAIDRINNVNESEADDFELRRKDAEIGVFRTKGYAATGRGGGGAEGVQKINSAVAPQQQQQQHLSSNVSISHPQQSDPTLIPIISMANQHQYETEEEKLERLTKLVAAKKEERRRIRAVKRATPEELSQALDVYHKLKRMKEREFRALV